MKGDVSLSMHECILVHKIHDKGSVSLLMHEFIAQRAREKWACCDAQPCPPYRSPGSQKSKRQGPVLGPVKRHNYRHHTEAAYCCNSPFLIFSPLSIYSFFIFHRFCVLCVWDLGEDRICRVIGYHRVRLETVLVSSLYRNQLFHKSRKPCSFESTTALLHLVTYLNHVTGCTPTILRLLHRWLQASPLQIPYSS